MFDHLSIGVTDFNQSMAFYDAVLKPLGFSRLVTVPEIAAYGTSGQPKFWIGYNPEKVKIQPAHGFHLAFQANSRSAVDAFYAAAIQAGAIDNGKPGLRPHYHPNYYAAFVLDPDGYHLEAACHLPG